MPTEEVLLFICTSTTSTLGVLWRRVLQIHFLTSRAMLLQCITMLL